MVVLETMRLENRSTFNPHTFIADSSQQIPIFGIRVENSPGMGRKYAGKKHSIVSMLSVLGGDLICPQNKGENFTKETRKNFISVSGNLLAVRLF